MGELTDFNFNLLIDDHTTCAHPRLLLAKLELKIHIILHKTPKLLADPCICELITFTTTRLEDAKWRHWVRLCMLRGSALCKTWGHMTTLWRPWSCIVAPNLHVHAPNHESTSQLAPSINLVRIKWILWLRAFLWFMRSKCPYAQTF